MNLNSEILTSSKAYPKATKPSLASFQKTSISPLWKGRFSRFSATKKDWMPPSDIVRLLHLSKGDVSMAVTHLEKAGYLSKTKDPEDKRKQHLALEKPADPFLQKVDRMRQRYFTQVFQGFDGNDIATFKHLLERISTNVSTHH